MHLPTPHAECQFLTKNGVTFVPHPPYLPHLALSNIFFVSSDEKILQEKRFADVEEVKQKLAEATKDVNTDEFKTVF